MIDSVINKNAAMTDKDYDSASRLSPEDKMMFFAPTKSPQYVSSSELLQLIDQFLFNDNTVHLFILMIKLVFLLNSYIILSLLNVSFK